MVAAALDDEGASIASTALPLGRMCTGNATAAAGRWSGPSVGGGLACALQGAEGELLGVAEQQTRRGAVHLYGYGVPASEPTESIGTSGILS
jgi:hypothetical protein